MSMDSSIVGFREGREGKNTKVAKEHYTRKKLNENIHLFKNTLHGYIQNGKNVKEKAHVLLLSLKPMLKFISNSTDARISGNVEEVRLQLRSFESHCKNFDVNDSSQIIENFHRALSEHLTTIEAEIRSEY